MKAAQLRSTVTTDLALRALYILGFSLLTAAAAQVRIPIPGTPVPMTMQTAVVLLAGLKLGARDGALSQVVYLLLGACGLHVFSGNTSGFAVLAGPTSGYLLGFVLAAWINGMLMRRFSGNSLLKTWLATFAASVFLFIPGLIVLRFFLPSWDATVAAGLTPFIVGDIVKVSLAAVGHLVTRRSDLV